MFSQQLAYVFPSCPQKGPRNRRRLIPSQVQNPIDLPQIAVVGSQSSGKSSVLENIVGRDLYASAGEVYKEGADVIIAACLEGPALLRDGRLSYSSLTGLLLLTFKRMA